MAHRERHVALGPRHRSPVVRRDAERGPDFCSYCDIVDDYEVLGLAPDASTEDAHRAWLSLATIFHPDRFEAGPAQVRAEAARRMSEVNAAYERIKQGKSSTSRTTMTPPSPDRETHRSADADAGTWRPATIDPNGRLFISRQPARVLAHPLTLVQPVAWPPLDHPNVLWYGGRHRAAGWSMTAEGPNMTILPSRLALHRRTLVRARPMTFTGGFIQGAPAGTAVTVFSTRLEDVCLFFDQLRSSAVATLR